MRRAWPIVLAFAVCAGSQDPIVGPQQRVSLDTLSKSGSETTGVASADGLEMLAGFVDFRTDGTIANSFSVTSDGGQSWLHLVLRAPAGYQDNLEADPMTAYDPRTNTLFAGGISHNKCIFVAQKIPGQNAFGPSRLAAASSWPDKGWMAAGPRPGLPDTTRLYVAYNEGIIWSDDLGVTWTPPQSLGVGYGLLPRVGPAGELYLTYWDGYWGIKFTKSLDGGQTWSTPVQPATRMSAWGVVNYGIPGTFRNFTNNAMAVNPVTGEIVILYVDQTNIVNGQKNLDLYFVRSGDGGATWTSSQRLPFRPLDQISDMIFPWIEFTKDGRLHLFAMDTAPTPGQTDGSSEGFWDQTYYYSEDSGTTWSSMIRLTPSSWRSSYHNTGATNFLGDYQGMAITDKAVFPVYPDTRLTQSEIYVNSIYNPIERPSSFQWNIGTTLGGSLSSLYKRDGDPARANPRLVANYGEAAQMETTLAVPTNNPSSMKVHVWGGVSTINLQQRVEMFNVVSGLWDTLDVRPAANGLANTVVDVTSPANYLAANTAKVRVTYRSILRRPTRSWTASIDQSVLLVVP